MTDQLGSLVGEHVKQVKTQRWLLRMIWGVFATLLGGGTLAGIQIAQQPGRVQQTIDHRVGDLEETLSGCRNGDECADGAKAQSVQGRLGNVEERTERLGHAVVEEQVRGVDSTNYLADKLDAVNPAYRDAVPKPATLQAAERKVESIKRQRRVDELFQAVDPDDLPEERSGS